MKYSGMYPFKYLAVGITCGVLLSGCGKIEISAAESTSMTAAAVERDAVEVNAMTAAAVELETTGTDHAKAAAVEPDTVEVNAISAAATLPTAELFTEEMEEQQPPEISLIMVGDILLHTPVENSAKQEDGTYDFSAIFAHTEEQIQAADLALVNQEVIIGGEALGISGYPAFNAPFAIGDALVDAGFDVVCHGTNHALDKGRKGLLNCLNFWKTTYPEITVLGIHDTAEDPIYIYEQDGIRVAILNYTYGTNGISLPSDMPFAVDLLEEKKVIEDIQKAEEAADFTIVCPHWGTEYELGISSSQEKWTEIFLENGVDLVLGTHPHVIEPIEWVTDEETGHQMLVYYSLGNFVNWTSGTGKGVANRMVGGMAQVTLTAGETGEVSVSSYDVMPVVAHLEKGINGVTVYPLSEYTEELAIANQIRNQDPSFSLQYCEDLCERVWGASEQ